MQEANKDFEVKDIEEPNGIIRASVCKDSGLSPSSLCSQDPRGNRVYEELFIEGTEPDSVCDTHVAANVNRFSNKLASPLTPSILTKSSVFIKKDHPNPATADYFMVLPSTYDSATDTPPAGNTNEAVPPVADSNNATAPPIVNEFSSPANRGNGNANKNGNNTHNSVGPGNSNSGALPPVVPGD